jgi:hypothetical protein
MVWLSFPDSFFLVRSFGGAKEPGQSGARRSQGIKEKESGYVYCFAFTPLRHPVSLTHGNYHQGQINREIKF